MRKGVAERGDEIGRGRTARGRRRDGESYGGGRRLGRIDRARRGEVDLRGRFRRRLGGPELGGRRLERGGSLLLHRGGARGAQFDHGGGGGDHEQRGADQERDPLARDERLRLLERG